MRTAQITATVLTALVFSSALTAEEKGKRLIWPRGWQGETITLPPGFAPDMKLKGVEEIRFAPGMFDPKAKDFFSYAFVFELTAETELSKAVVEREFLVYYRGLARAVMRDPKLDVSKFALTLEDSKKDSKSPAPRGVRRYAGALSWIEPFRTKQAQRLFIELDAWTELEHTYVFACVSPAKTSEAIWKDLRSIRSAFHKSRRPEWSSFRGHRASGVADGHDIPAHWSLEKKENVRWNVPLPGLAHSSPVVWGDRVFLTSAISSKKDASFRPGLYGAGDASPDRSPHRWVVLCIDAKTGATLWETTAAKGTPKDKRHVKATYANATPATDGKHVVAMFGSEGLFAFDASGKKLWRKDLGRLDVGAYNLREYEWGSASSPIIYQERVIVQCDTQNESFVLAADIGTGKTVWTAKRDELPSWGTPTICAGPGGPELVTNASNFIRAYDPASGKELWKLGGSSKITAPTPIFSQGIIVVASGRAPERPIFAIRAGSRGTLTLVDGKTSSQAIAWSKVRRGPYMPTPIIVGTRVYVLGNSGLFDSYDLKTGKEQFRTRIDHGGLGFSASPVASDGRIFLSSEDGEVFVVKAGATFELVAKNELGEPIIATPAIANGTLFVRTQRRLVAIGR